MAGVKNPFMLHGSHSPYRLSTCALKLGSESWSHHTEPTEPLDATRRPPPSKGCTLMHRRLQAPLFARFAAGGADAGKTGAPNSKLSSTRATALAIALAASAPISTAPPAGAATTNTATDTTAATADSSRATSTTQKLTSGYMAADQETVADNPVTSQVTAMLAADTTRQCANQRTCDAAGQVSTAPADNVGTGRLRTNRQRGHVALDRTVESAGARVVLSLPSFDSAASAGQTSPGKTTPTDAATAGASEPALTISGTAGYQRATTAEPNGTGAVSHTLSYKAEVPPAQQDKEDPWSSFGTTAPAEGERTCVGSIAFNYDSGGDLDTIVFTHATEGTAREGIAGVTPGATVTSILTTTLEVPLLSEADQEIATSYARRSALASGTLDTPLTALSPTMTPGQGFADIVSAHATTTRQILEGAALKDHGGADALAQSWTASRLAADRKQLATQDL